METESNQIVAILSQFWPYAAAVFTLVLLIAAGVVGHRLLNPSDTKIIDAQIQNLVETFATDVVIPDGIYGYHFINYVILLPNKILLLGVEDFPGYIFGADNLEKWTQVLDSKSLRFDNPVMSKSHCIQSMQPLVAGKEVIARVVFTSNSDFPKGKPSGVIEQRLLEQELRALLSEPAEDDLSELWVSLVTEFEIQKQNCKKDS
jgi:hypothetical protein